jgi:hypothetical protein
MGIQMHATDSVEYDPGIYRAKLQKVDEQESQFTDDVTGEPKWQYIWTFELLEEGYEGNTLTGWSSTNFGPRAKARAWAEALVGRQINSGENISGDDLIGKECDLMITLKSGDRGSFAKIESVNPRRRRKGESSSSSSAARKPAKENVEINEEDFEDLPF